MFIRLYLIPTLVLLEQSEQMILCLESKRLHKEDKTTL